MNREWLYKVVNRISAYSFYFLLALVPLAFSPANFELFEFPKMMLVYATTVVILFLWAAKSILAGKVIFRRTSLDLPLLAFLVSQFLSSLVSIDMHTSLWGFYTRAYGGLLSLGAFALLYWAYVSNMEKRKTQYAIRFLLASALVISVWGILEHTGHSPSCLFMRGTFDTSCWVPNVSERVFASFGQPNWMAAWLAAIAPLSWTLLVKRHTANEKSSIVSRVAGYVLPILVFLALLYTRSTSGLLGFAAAFVVFWILVLPHATNHTRRVFAVLITIHLSLFTLVGTRFTPSISQMLAQRTTKDINQPSPSPSPNTTDALSTDSFAIRKIVWRGAIDIWKAYPIFGSGVETFAYTYYNFRPAEHNLTSEWDLLYNKAHNEYLHYLANTGIVGLGSYLLLIGVFSWWYIKKMWEVGDGKLDVEVGSEKSHFTLLTSLAAGFASILVTNFVGFSTIPVATLFFLYPAMAVATSQNEKRYTQNETTSHTKPAMVVSFLFVLLFTFYVLSRVAGLYRADTLYARADKLNSAGQQKLAAELAHQAIKLRPEPRYYNELAVSTSAAATLSEEQQPEEAAEFAKLTEDFSNKALQISPRNVNFWVNRAVIFKNLTGIDKKYLDLATEAAEKAVELAPTEPEIRYNLGVLYERTNQPQKALTTLTKAVELKPDYFDARLGLAQFYLNNGERAKAAKQLEEAVKIDPRDKTVIDLLKNLK